MKHQYIFKPYYSKDPIECFVEVYKRRKFLWWYWDSYQGLFLSEQQFFDLLNQKKES